MTSLQTAIEDAVKGGYADHAYCNEFDMYESLKQAEETLHRVMLVLIRNVQDIPPKVVKELTEALTPTP